MEDNRIIELLHERNEKGLSELSDKYGKEMKSVSFGICRNAQDAEEVFNDSLIGIWNAIPPEWPRVLSSYVFRIVRNLSIKIVRRAHAGMRGETLSMDQILEELGDIFEAGEDKESESGEITLALNRYVESCTDMDRFLFMRRYFYYDSISEIASRANMSGGAVAMRLSRMRSGLKEYLKKEGIWL